MTRQIYSGSSRPLAFTLGLLLPIGSCSAVENAGALLLPAWIIKWELLSSSSKKSLDDDKRTGKHRGGQEMLNDTVRHFFTDHITKFKTQGKRKIQRNRIKNKSMNRRNLGKKPFHPKKHASFCCTNRQRRCICTEATEGRFK